MSALKGLVSCLWLFMLCTQLSAANRQNEDQLITVVYQVADIVIPLPSAEHPQPNASVADASLLIKLLENCIASSPSTSYAFHEKTLSLVARHSKEGHQEIQSLLSQIRKLRDIQITLAFEVHTIPPTKDLEALELTAPRVLTPLEKHLVQNSFLDESTARNGIKVTVFNGQEFQWELDQNKKAESPSHRIISTQATISADRREVRLVFTIDDEQGSTKEITVKDGQTIILDPLGMKPAKMIIVGDKTITTLLDGTLAGDSFWNGWQTDDGHRTVITVKPHIIIQEEEEVRLGLPE